MISHRRKVSEHRKSRKRRRGVPNNQADKAAGVAAAQKTKKKSLQSWGVTLLKPADPAPQVVDPQNQFLKKNMTSKIGRA
jgi:hypothetical protein